MNLPFSSLTAISPLDGRYHAKTRILAPIVSEYGLLFQRVVVEIRWLQCLARYPLPDMPLLSPAAHDFLDKLILEFSSKDAEEIKIIEKQTNHDVKAIEYFLQTKFNMHAELKSVIPFIHFACTSEDINNLAYNLLIITARDQILLPALKNINERLSALIQIGKNIPLLARTHGQAATPTTVGKELQNVFARLIKIMSAWQTQPLTGKCNGAVGNFNAHHVAYPEVNWPLLSQQFVESLGFEYNPWTTQIEPHDSIVTFLNSLTHINSILIDFARDCWGYISLDYFRQKLAEHEVGSSTMPHKVNPIDFENAEGNLGLGNAMMRYLSTQLPTSRFQRDLVDSTVLRNLGSCFAYSLLGYTSLLTGMNKITFHPEKMAADLNEHWEVLTEAVQTVMRRYGLDNPYERLKTLSRGQALSKESLHTFIDTLEIPLAVKTQLKTLTPATYLGYAAELADL